MKTTDLIGTALNWAVAKCEGNIWEGDWYFCPSEFKFKIGHYPKGLAVAKADGGVYNPQTDWAQGGPIIERERLTVTPGPQWAAMLSTVNQPLLTRQYGPTALVAAMRCYVASKFGDEIEIPEKLQ